MPIVGAIALRLFPAHAGVIPTTIATGVSITDSSPRMRG